LEGAKRRGEREGVRRGASRDGMGGGGVGRRTWKRVEREGNK